MTASDVLFIGIVVFIIGIMFFGASFGIKTIVSEVVKVPAINSSTATVQAFNDVSNVPDNFDYITLGVFIGFIIGLIITSWLVPTHPIFMIAYILFIVIVVVISPVLSNTWETFTNNAEFGSTINDYPITNHILSYLPYYMAVIGIIGLIVMFAKPKSVEG